MEQLAQDLSIALEESKSCGSANFKCKRWGIRRRTRSAGNLHLCLKKTPDNHSDDDSSSNSEPRLFDTTPVKNASSGHQSDSDETTSTSKPVTRSESLRLQRLFELPRNRCKCSIVSRTKNYILESDSFNENSPAVRPNMRRKRKLRRMHVSETPVVQCGKRKRPQRIDHSWGTFLAVRGVPGASSTVLSDQVEFKHPMAMSCDEPSVARMETQYYGGDDPCEVASESSLSLSGGEGHDGDDELTDWAPPMDNSPSVDAYTDGDPREIRAGCRRLRNERPGFTISTVANEKVARFLQDSERTELQLYGCADREKLAQLAALYSLEFWHEGSNSLLRKTKHTPCMQPAQRHHVSHYAAHKKFCSNQPKH